MLCHQHSYVFYADLIFYDFMHAKTHVTGEVLDHAFKSLVCHYKRRMCWPYPKKN